MKTRRSARRALTGREAGNTAEKCRRAHPGRVKQSCAAGKLPRGMWRNQDLYSMRERKSSVIRGEFFGMVPGVGREGLNHEGHEGPRRKAARDSGSYAGMRSRGIFNFLSKL